MLTAVKKPTMPKPVARSTEARVRICDVRASPTVACFSAARNMRSVMSFTTKIASQAKITIAIRCLRSLIKKSWALSAQFCHMD